MNGILSPALERRPTERQTNTSKQLLMALKRPDNSSAEPAYLALKSLNENCNNNFCSEKYS